MVRVFTKLMLEREVEGAWSYSTGRFGFSTLVIPVDALGVEILDRDSAVIGPPAVALAGLLSSLISGGSVLGCCRRGSFSRARRGPRFATRIDETACDRDWAAGSGCGECVTSSG